MLANSFELPCFILKTAGQLFFTQLVWRYIVWVSIYLTRKYQFGTLYLRFQLETGPPFYVVIRATRARV